VKAAGPNARGPNSKHVYAMLHDIFVMLLESGETINSIEAALDKAAATVKKKGKR
jgi:hypothetical protein